MAKSLPLTRGLRTILNNADHLWASKFNWCAHDCGDRGRPRFYAVRREGRRYVYLHREILGARQGDVCDHRNRDSLDNRRRNLRLVTKSQSNVNRARPERADGRPWTSQYRGVDCVKGRWRARIVHLGKMIVLGTFGAEREAAEAFDRAARQLRGKDAQTNFPGER